LIWQGPESQVGVPNQPESGRRRDLVRRVKGQAATANSSDFSEREAAMAEKPYDIMGSIIAYERGELTDDETAKLVECLVDSGTVGVIQGHYRRTAEALVEGRFIPIDPGIAADV